MNTSRIHLFAEDLPDNAICHLIPLKKWILFICENEGQKVEEISFIFCSDKYLHGLNRKFLNKDDYTDVIAFDYTESERIKSDIFISLDRVADNAMQLGEDIERETKRVMAHGLLHLFGYNDKKTEERMRMTEREEFYLEKENSGLAK